MEKTAGRQMDYHFGDDEHGLIQAGYVEKKPSMSGYSLRLHDFHNVKTI